MQRLESAQTPTVARESGSEFWDSEQSMLFWPSGVPPQGPGSPRAQELHQRICPESGTWAGARLARLLGFGLISGLNFWRRFGWIWTGLALAGSGLILAWFDLGLP